MKILNLIALAVLATGMFTGCSQDEVVEKSTAQMIGFKAMTDKPVGRVGELTSNFTRFRVYGCTTDKDAVTNHAVIFGYGADGNLFTIVSRDTAEDPWTYSNTQYWAVDRDYYFVALTTDEVNPVWRFIAPENHESALSTTNFKGFGTVTFNNKAAGSDGNSIAGVRDLAYATAAASTSKDADGNLVPMGTVQLTFKHLLSAVSVYVTNGMTNATDYTFKVTNFYLSNSIAKGSVKLGEDKLEWIPDGSETTSFYMDLANEEVTLIMPRSSNKYFIIPGKQTLKVSFDVEVLLKGTTYAIHRGLTGEIPEQTYEAGKYYILSMSLNQDNIHPTGSSKIEFNVTSVEGWGSGTGLNIDIKK